jgi:hypothetical protein
MILIDLIFRADVIATLISVSAITIWLYLYHCLKTVDVKH